MQRLSNIAEQLSVNKTSTQDVFDHLKLAPADPILGTALAYKADKDPNKVNLGIGAYRTDDSKPYVLNVVKEAEFELAQETRDGKLDKEYLGVDGLAEFNASCQNLLFGDNNPLVTSGRVVTAQCLSGTGSLRVAFEFLAKFIPADVYVSNPTWGNHNSIIQNSGLKVQTYPYFCPKTKGLDFEGMMKTLSAAKAGSIVLLHACAHNPTGVDPTPEQWEQICALVKSKGLYTFFDSAYQGYASGNLQKDALSLQIWQKHGVNFMVAQSFAKNFGLYGERIGALHIVVSNKDVAARVLSQLKLVIRAMYSNPPAHGARLVQKVLGCPKRRAQWEVELKQMADRINNMRASLKAELVKLNVKGNWDHITNQIGMFSYTGLTTPQCEVLINKWHIYLINNGRISMAGVTSKNVQYLAKAIKDAVDTA